MADRLRRTLVVLFVLAFFLYLFGPLILMSITAFNSSSFPRVAPWGCFSAEWFNVLAHDDHLMTGLRNSLLIGFGVVTVAVPLGLAGALMLMQVRERIRPWYYTIVIAPILIPGVVLGISTLLFWDRVGSMLGMSRESIFYNGFFLTIIGQATFISAYTMLVFIARLQRFDPALEEAALDLGASHVQAFRKILLPFLKPAIASAAVLAFLASFENYNTTIFTILSASTLTTVLANQVRYGINPSISALAVVIVVLTLLGAAIFEVYKRREAAAEREAGRIARGEQTLRKARIRFAFDPAVVGILAIFLAGLGTVYFAGTIGVGECKAQVKTERQRDIQERVRLQRQKFMFDRAAPSVGGSTPVQRSQRGPVKGTESFQGVFSTQNLEDQAGDKTKATPPAKGTSNFQSTFSPDNLKDQSGSSNQ